MPVFELTEKSLAKIEYNNFISLAITENAIQKVLRTQISEIFPDLYVLTEEFSDWEDSSRSIDLLCLDDEANLVVVELKRTEDGGHMELQAIRYAAMVNAMTFEKAVETHAKFLKKIESSQDAQSAILSFLEWDTPDVSKFAQDVRILLISGEFSKEITTSVMWLNNREVDIRCVRMLPYKVGDKTLLDIQQVIPLPEAIEYQVQLRKKEAEKRQAQSSDWTKYELLVGSVTISSLYKRHLFLRAVQELITNRGQSPASLMGVLPAAKFLSVEGNLNSEGFKNRILGLKTPSGSAYDFRRYFCADGELINVDEKTIALSNQWSRYDLPLLDKLISPYPDIKYKPLI